jgi:hypothetical protein
LKRGDELLKTVQMPVYGAAMLNVWSDVREFVLAHHYVSKKGVDSLFRAATVTPDQIAARMREIARLVERMKTWAAATDQNDVPVAESAETPTKDACHARTGCPHQSICSAFTNRSTPAMQLSESEAALFDDVPDLDAPVAPTPALSDDVPELDEPVAGAAPPAPAPAAPAAAPALTGVQGKRMKFQDVNTSATKPTPDNVCACGETITKDNGSQLQSGNWVHLPCPLTTTATPPDQPTSDPKLASEQPPPPPAPKAKGGKKAPPPLPPKDSPRESDTDRAARGALDAIAESKKAADAAEAAIHTEVSEAAVVVAKPAAEVVSVDRGREARIGLAETLEGIAKTLRAVA